MILALINKGVGNYGQGGTQLSATDLLVFGGGTSGGGTAETDPTVASHVKNITTAQISNWDAAYNWGNHNGLYRPASWVPSWTDVTGKPNFNRSTPGLVPAPGGTGTDRFLREDGNWAVPTGTGGGGDSTPSHVNQITTTQIANWDTAYGWGNHAGLYAPNNHTHSRLYGLWTDNLNSFSGTYGDFFYHYYSASAINKPVQVNNANAVLTMFSHVDSYGKQIAFADNEDLYIRRIAFGGYGVWRKLWHDGNLTAPLSAGISAAPVSKVWVGTTAQLPGTRSADTLYFVTD